MREDTGEVPAHRPGSRSLRAAAAVALALALLLVVVLVGSVLGGTRG